MIHSVITDVHLPAGFAGPEPMDFDVRCTALAPGVAVWAGAEDTFPVPVQVAADGEVIRGLRLVSTPGHTAGHLSLLLSDDGVLLIGDLIGSSDGQLVRAPAPFTADAAEAERSLHKASQLEFADLLPSHGAPSSRQALRHLLNSQ